MKIRREEISRRDLDNHAKKTANREKELPAGKRGEKSEEQKQVDQQNDEFQQLSADYLKKKYFNPDVTDFNATMQTQTYYYLTKQNEVVSKNIKYDDASLKKNELKALIAIIPSKTLRDDFVNAYIRSAHFRELVKQADFYNGTIEASTKETSTTSEFDQKNQYVDSKIKIIPGTNPNPNVNTSTNIIRMTWELTNMKNHAAFIDLENKARAKSIDKVTYVKAVIALEAEGALNDKLVLMDAGGSYSFEGLQKYDKMKQEELIKNKAQFIKDYVAVKYDTVTIEKQGEKTTAKDKYGADYDQFIKEGPLKAPGTIPSGEPGK